jgi:hypothetical protein
MFAACMRAMKPLINPVSHPADEAQLLVNRRHFFGRSALGIGAALRPPWPPFFPTMAASTPRP